jgi:hypothetical protein
MPNEIVEQQPGGAGSSQPAVEAETLSEHREQREAEQAERYAGQPAEAEKRTGRSPGFQARLDKLTKDKYAAQRTAEDLQRQLDSERARVGQPAQPQHGQEARPGEGQQPGQEKTAQATEQPKPPEQLQREAQEYHGQMAQKFSSEVARHPEYKELVEAVKGAQVNAYVAQAIPLLPNGVEVFAHLARNPAERDRLHANFMAVGNGVYRATGNGDLALRSAIAAVSDDMESLSAALRWGTAGRASGPTRQIEKPVSTAPTPITPVGAGAGPQAEEDDADKMTMAQYRAQREKSRNPRRG